MGPRLNAFRFSVCLLALIPAACAGGGGSSSVMPAAQPAQIGSGSSAPATIAFTLAIPQVAPTAARRSPRYISGGTKSIAVTYGGARQVVDCSATCSMTLQVQPGSVTFVASLYDGVAGTGNLLSTGQTTATVVGGAQNTIQITFGGVPATVALSLAKTVVTAGVAASVAVAVTAKDAAGYTIVGTEPYSTPIVLSNDDRSGATLLSAAAVSAPSATVTLAYNGSSNVASAHIGATIPGTGIAASPVTFSIANPPAPAPPIAPPGSVPLHATTWYYFGLNQVNASIPAAWMVAHADYVEDDGYAAEHAEAFKDAGGKYAVSYTDPAYVPYCYGPFAPPVKACDGPIGNHITDESAWYHDASGGRVHHFVDNEFQYQEALNPASAAARDAYTWYTSRLISRAPKVDFFLADDMGGTFIGPDGTQLAGWFYGYNAPAVETTTDAQFIPAAQAMLAAAVRPVIVNGYDPGTRLPSYGGKWLDSPNVVGDEYEGCYGDSGGLASEQTGKWSGQSNGILQVIAHRGKALCMMTAPSNPSNRIYLLASWWMTYSEANSIAAPERPTSDGFTVVPEYDIVPRQPRATATADIAALRSATGAYVREFAACYQGGTPIGPCATIVNPTSSPVAMPRLVAAYTKSLAVDDKSAYTGGQATWTGSVPAQLAAVSAVVVR